RLSRLKFTRGSTSAEGKSILAAAPRWGKEKSHPPQNLAIRRTQNSAIASIVSNTKAPTGP
ncbi:MAG: hypothetical protein OXF94_11145, partial [Gammaproteobacteria bacterium]|nr:hypothetical protein [Gammaproteobacteria bacterium]